MTQGSKYEETKGLQPKEITKRIRADVKAAIKAGDLPKGLKVSVRKNEYAGGWSIDVEIMAFPGAIHTVEWVEHTYGEKREGFPPRPKMFTADVHAAVEKLTEITNAYNYNASDPMTDYFNYRFADHINVNRGLRERAIYRIRRELNLLTETEAIAWDHFESKGLDPAEQMFKVAYNGSHTWNTWSLPGSIWKEAC